MKKILIIAAALVLLLSGCAPNPLNDPSLNAQSHRAVLQEQAIEPLNAGFVKGLNGFGLKAANQLYTTDGNLALSPASLGLALCMTRTGASDDTAADMAQTLGLSELDDQAIIDACRSLIWRANTGGMEAANAIWLQKDLTFSDDFLSACTQDFMADAYPLVIPGTKDAVNAWADEKTHGRIKEIVTKEFDPNTAIVLANALYYLGEWVQPFEAINTRDGEFNAPNGKVTVPFMYSAWTVPYYRCDDFSMISLDFQSADGEGRYAMAFLLPEADQNLGDLLGTLDADQFAKALDGAEKREVWIKLPKFEFSYFADMMDTLAALGMSRAFGPEADFSAMTAEPNDIYISEVLHKCYIRVDELGAEAAAVTEVAATDGAAEIQEEPPKFYADRPFLFAIVSLEDGAIAFMGAVNDPSQK